MNTRRPFFPVLVSALALAAPAVATAQTGGSRVFGDLLKRIPEQTNALMFVNIDGLYDSPIGRRENWRQRAQENRRDRLGLAAEYSKAAVAVGMDFQSLQEHWKVGMIQLRSTPPKLENLAAREGGYVETIENMPVAWTPRGFDLFVFPDNILGFVSPTDRQGIVSWIRSTLSHPRTFPPGFADRAIFRADSGAQVVLAFNLADSVSAKMIEPWLNAIESIKKSHTDAKLLAPRLASVKSAFLVVTADQDIQGSLRFDFERPVDYTAPVARELILTLLDDCGADLPELKTWTLGFDKKSPAVEMSGRLSVESLRKILSVAQPPELSPESRSTATASASASTPTPAPAAPKPAPASSRNDGLAASQGYFRSVTSLMDGLKKTDRPTYQSTKLWYDRYAKRIEELPILNVDKELLDWGGAVARTLREMSSGVNYYSQNQKYSLATSSNGYYGGYNGYYVNSRSYDQAVIKRQSDAKMSVDLDARWQALETSVADMRRKMVEKYMVDF